MTLIPKPQRDALAAQIKSDIDEYCRVTYDDGHRNHLGASMIGHECSRYLWYVFRWVYHEKVSGRARRLFNRGHREEDRFIEWLTGIGFKLRPLADDGNQHRMSGVGGHYGGSLDGLTQIPERYHSLFAALAQIGEFLVEFKTNGTGPNYQELLEKGVQKAKPRHYAQMCTYGAKYKLRYAIYFNICKNDDELHVEVVELDWKYGEELEAKAGDVIVSKLPPPRLNESPAYYKCKQCAFLDICHKGAAYEMNCRSCDFATPVDGGKWWCGKWGAEIPKEAIPLGCGQWKPVGRL